MLAPNTGNTLITTYFIFLLLLYCQLLLPSATYQDAFKVYFFIKERSIPCVLKYSGLV